MSDNEIQKEPVDGSCDLVPGVRAMVQALASSDRTLSSQDGLELIGVLEQLKCAAEGLQLELAARVLATQREQAEQTGPHAAARVAASVGHQVALARRAAPSAGRTAVQLATFVRAGLPKVYAALRAGATSEWAVSLIARETSVLSAEHRAAVDEALAGDPVRLTLLGPKAAQTRARQLVAELDPAAIVARRRKAESERHVSLRPAPDGMTWLSALLPLAAGVGTLAALTRAADTARGNGDQRSRGQVMADELAHRVIAGIASRSTATDPETTASDLAPGPDPTRWGGAYSAAKDHAAREHHTEPVPADMVNADTGNTDTASTTDGRAGGGDPTAMTPDGVGIVVNLIMTDRQLFGSGPESEGTAWCEGYGPIDADLARELARGAPSPSDRIWIRRLFADRAGRLAAMESRARLFPAGVRTMIKLRDQVCRTPYCNAPIRHIDHVVDHATQGATSVDNGQGYCEACNYAKQAVGWMASPCPVSGRITITTPGGQTYSTLPPLLGVRQQRIRFADVVFVPAA